MEIQTLETGSHRIEGTINITAQNIYKKYRWHRKYISQEGYKEAQMDKLIEGCIVFFLTLLT